MVRNERDDVRSSYDAVAVEYARRLLHELDGKPFDQTLLKRFAGLVRAGGTIADVGCGPGHVARFLADQGATVCGVDLSEKMVEKAKELHPGIDFLQGDLRSLLVTDHGWAGIVAFYSIIHLRKEEMEGAFRELARALEPGAPLLLAFHVGDDVLHLDEWWGREVSIDFYFFRPAEVQGRLDAAGFTVGEVLERNPYAPDVEHQSRRCYLLASAPA